MLAGMTTVCARGGRGPANDTAADTVVPAVQPQVEIAPAETADGYRLFTGDIATLTVAAAGADRVELLFKPVTASDRVVRLRTIDRTDNGRFTAELKTPRDFNGELWARARYPTGEFRESERIRIARREAAQNGQLDAQADTDESARADKFTGGSIERGKLQPGNGHIRITVNVPSFTLTFWQEGREVAKYYVGVGRKTFPIPIGLRSADRIILNPDWVPPNSEWVRESRIEPYERIPASDPDNPLGKIKVPLGNAYLLHEAQAPADIGNLVSHGCVRVMRDDIFDITKKVVRARGADISDAEIDAARKDSRRREIDLRGEVPVDINYDTMVVEGGSLHIYPDVYDRSMNTIENLRQELESSGVDVSKLDEKTLRQMLDRVNADRKFVVAISDITSGNALAKGLTEPLTPQQARDKPAA